MDISGQVLTFLLLLVTEPVIVGCAIAWTVANLQRPPSGRYWLGQIAVISVFVFPWTMVLDPWPLRVAFWISRPALNRLADRIESGLPIESPATAGVFSIVKANRGPVGSRNIALILDDDPSGRSGFVRIIDPIDPYGNEADRLMTNLNFNIRFDQSWSYQDED